MTKIYTKTGDQGMTHGPEGRVSKDSPLIQALGSLDELNASLGIVEKHVRDIYGKERSQNIMHIQNTLLDIGSDMFANKSVNFVSNQIALLERWIDLEEAELTPLKDFIIPGGSVISSHLHLARAICRRAERDVVTLKKDMMIEGFIWYLNRLSDYLFVLARRFNKEEKDVLWKPMKIWINTKEGS